MLVFNQEVFDEIISGTTTTWYTSSEFNALLGSAEHLRVIAFPFNLSGTSPGLNLYIDGSSDNQHWHQINLIGSFGLTNNTPVSGQRLGDHPSFARLRIQLFGTLPTCRLKIGVTGRLT